MINKPKKLSYSDLLRAKDINALVAENAKAQSEYEKHILTELVKEFGTASLGELLICVVEKHHKTLKVKDKPGAKEKWSPLLCAMIKAEVDAKRQSSNSLKAVIQELSKDPLWKVFIGDNDESFRKAYKKKPTSWLNKYVKHLRSLKDEWREQLEAEVKRFRDLI